MADNPLLDTVAEMNASVSRAPQDHVRGAHPSARRVVLASAGGLLAI